MSDTTDETTADLVDSDTRRCLCDVGAEGHSIAEAVTPAGGRSLWFLDDAQLNADGTDHGNPRPPHELLGPLPPDLASRIRSTPIRCGRPCADGHPCRIEVSAPGHACGWHRRAVR